jgi:hypothetical protein
MHSCSMVHKESGNEIRESSVNNSFKTTWLSKIKISYHSGFHLLHDHLYLRENPLFQAN